MNFRRVVAAAVCALIAAGCGSSSNVDGSRDGPQPIGRQRLFVDGDGRTVHATLNCGGTFRVTEKASEVSITYLAPHMAPGAASCAIIRVSTVLRVPLAGRALVDGVDGAPLKVFDLSALDRPASDVAAAVGGPSWSAGSACPNPNVPAAEIACGAQEYSLAGVSGLVTLVQDLADSDPPYNTNPVPTEQVAPWCLVRGGRGFSKCGSVACRPVAGGTGFVACDPPQGAFRRYVTWQSGDYRLYLASNQPVDEQVLAHVAGTVA
jgi:hypothetical protein